MRLINQLVVLLLSMTGTAMAQQTGSHLQTTNHKHNFDGLSHIEIDLGQRNTLLIGFDRYAQVRQRQNVDSVLRLFVADYQQVADTTQNPTHAVHARFRLGQPDRSLEVRVWPQVVSSFRFRSRNAPLSVKTQQDTLQISWTADVSASSDVRKKGSSEAFVMYLFINSLADIGPMLARGGVNGKVETALASVQQYKAHDLTNPKMGFDMVQGTDEKAKFIGPGLARAPFISIQPGFGVGLVRNQWVPSLKLDLQLIPNRYRNVSYGIGYSSSFFFAQTAADGRFQTFRNDFLTVGVAFYQPASGGKANPFSRQLGSFFVGLPVYRSGPYFDRNTIQLGGTVYQKGLFRVQPELYMNGFFKNVYPGVRLAIGL